MKRLVLAYAGLLLIGSAWGVSFPMVKIAVEGGYTPTGIMVLQLSMTVLGLALWQVLSGGWRRIPLDPAHLRLYAVVGVVGMAVPHLASLVGTARLPAGVMAIVMSLVPMLVLPLSLALGLETFRARRLVGVLLGATAVLMLVGPETSLPEPGLWVWVLVGAIAPLFYAFEGMYVSHAPARGAGPFTVLWIGSAVALVIVFPLAALGGGLQWPADGLGRAEWAIIGSEGVSVLGYAGYILVLRLTGPVFGAQVSFVVTGMGVVWSMILLGERYSLWVWGALLLLFMGLFLVQPRGAASEATDHA
jgi:drug/metabolite transporter (DMT)-like permease